MQYRNYNESKDRNSRKSDRNRIWEHNKSLHSKRNRKKKKDS